LTVGHGALEQTRIENTTDTSYFLARPKNTLKPRLDIFMTTLTAAPLAPLLDRLFADADAAEPLTDAAVADLLDEEQARLLRSKTDHGELYRRMKNLPLAVSRETSALLYMLARSSGARTIVEFGTSFGISTLHLAAALRDNGGGRLITSEFEPSKAARA
jgi:predicted O-methyltransferase YrrM